jgi:DHA1 family bicyclomycin/chloramphenicol resistance-like MFS transporter
VAPLIGLLGNNAVAMGGAMLVGLLAALTLLVTVVRPWELEDMEADEPVLEAV